MSSSSKLEQLDIRWIMSQVIPWWEKYHIFISRHVYTCRITDEAVVICEGGTGCADHHGVCHPLPSECDGISRERPRYWGLNIR